MIEKSRVSCKIEDNFDLDDVRSSSDVVFNLKLWQQHA